MIKLNVPYTYIERAVPVTGTLQIEISGWITTRTAIIYTIEDFIVLENGAKHQINARQKRIEVAKYNQLDAYLKQAHSFENLDKHELEFEKTKLGLLHFVKNDLIDDGIHTIYAQLPENWILS